MTEQLTKTLQIALAQAMSNLHTATIARVTAVNSNTIDCKPVINRVVNGTNIELPVFAEVPLVVLQGGGSYTSYPIAVGDYCLILFAERCFDRWYSGDDFVEPAEFRMHDYSDGFAIVGINPLASAVAIPDVITQEGDTEQIGNYNHTGNRDQVGNQTVDGDHSVTGKLTFGASETDSKSGVSGSFTSGDGKAITVTNGIVTGIV